jgi:hypothetical protein
MEPRRASVTAAIGCVAALIGCSRLSAHHSFSSEFDASAPVTLTGSVSRVDWTNPHAWIYISVPDTTGRVVVWAIETSPPNALSRHGLRLDNLVPGANVVVRGYRARDGKRSARGRELTLPDGRTLSLGSPSAENAR